MSQRGSSSARRRAFLATVSSGADLGARQVTQLLVLIVLARLLTPSEFGTVALLGTLVAVGTVVADAGLTVSILQRETFDDRELSACFWLSLVLGLSATLVVAGFSWALAAAFDMPGHAELAALMSLAILATAMGQTHAALLVKRQLFLRLLTAGVVAAALAGALSIWLAWRGAGVWALGTQFVAMPVLYSATLMVVGGWRPMFLWDGRLALTLLVRGRWVAAATLVDVSYQRLLYAGVGWLFGPASLGNYQRADSTTQFANDAAGTVVGRVALPLFAQSSGEPALLRAGYRTGVRSTAAFAAPAMALLAALSAPFLDVVFGPQWVAASPILTALAVAGLLWPLHIMAINVLYAAGENRLVFRIDLLKKLVAVTLLIIALPFGVVAVALAQIGFGIVGVVINGWAVHRTIGLPLRGQIASAAGPTVLAAAVGSAVMGASAMTDLRPLVALPMLASAGLVGYLLLALIFRIDGVLDILALIRRKADTADV